MKALLPIVDRPEIEQRLSFSDAGSESGYAKMHLLKKNSA
jgi:hypothetical protein